MLKIIFLIDDLNGGGSEKAVKIVVEELSKQFSDEIHLVLIQNQRDYGLASFVRCSSLVDKLSIYNIPIVLFRYLRVVFKIKPDIQICTKSKSHIVGVFIKIFMGIRTIINCQNNIVANYRSRPLIFRTLIFVYRFTDGFIFISRGIHKKLRSHLLDKDMFFIPNPVNMEEVNAKRNDLIEEMYSEIFSKPVLITVGSLTEQKAQHILLKAFSYISSECNLMILGVGERELELKQLCTSLGISEHVFFVGFQKNPFKFLRKAFAFVLSSEWEGFGNVIIEAMACGLPVVSTDCPSGPREILAPNTERLLCGEEDIEFAQHGILVPVNDDIALGAALNNIMDNKKLRKYYSARSRCRAHDFIKENIAQAYHDMIHQVSNDK